MYSVALTSLECGWIDTPALVLPLCSISRLLEIPLWNFVYLLCFIFYLIFFIQCILIVIFPPPNSPRLSLPIKLQVHILLPPKNKNKKINKKSISQKNTKMKQKTKTTKRLLCLFLECLFLEVVNLVVLIVSWQDIWEWWLMWKVSVTSVLTTLPLYCALSWKLAGLSFSLVDEKKLHKQCLYLLQTTLLYLPTPVVSDWIFCVSLVLSP